MNAADLGLTSRAPLGMKNIESFTLQPYSRMTLAEIPGSGTIRQVFLALGGPHGCYDGRLEFTVDGAATPQVSPDLGTLFATHFGQGLNKQWSSNRAHVEINAGGGTVGYMFKLPVPFRNGAKVTLSNPSSTPLTVYSQIAWTADGDPAPVMLRSNEKSWIQAQTIAKDKSVTLLDTPGSGWLAWLSVTGLGLNGSAISWLERDVVMTVNGETTARYWGSGFEDFFGGSFYFQNRQGFGMPWALIGAVDPNAGVASLACDLVELYGGVRYDNGMNLTLGTEGVVSADHRQSHCVLYYQDLAAA